VLLRRAWSISVLSVVSPISCQNGVVVTAALICADCVAGYAGATAIDGGWYPGAPAARGGECQGEQPAPAPSDV
jgi:hypothetical protein